MHSLGLAPTPASAGWGSLGGMQSGLQCLESALTMWGTVILPGTSKQEIEVLSDMPSGSHSILGKRAGDGVRCIRHQTLLHSSSLVDKAHQRAWLHDFYQVIVGQVSTPHQASVTCL